MSFNVHAQTVVYRDINPDKSVAAFWPQSASDTVRLAYDSSTSTPITLRAILDTPGASITCLGGDCQLLDSTATDSIASLDSNTDLGPNTTFGTWVTPDAIKGEMLFDPNGSGHWQQVMNKYMGVRFKLNGSWNYAWVYMTVFYAWGSGMLTVAIQSYAYDTSGNNITTGVVPPPASVSVLKQLKDVSATVHNRVIRVNGIDEPYSYKLIDMFGKVVSTHRKYTNNRIAASDVPLGMYLLHINTSKGHYTTKLMIQ